MSIVKRCEYDTHSVYDTDSNLCVDHQTAWRKFGLIFETEHGHRRGLAEAFRKMITVGRLNAA